MVQVQLEHEAVVPADAPTQGFEQFLAEQSGDGFSDPQARDDGTVGD